MPANGSIVVIGSMNMDLVFRTPRLPRPGETVLGGGFSTFPGGKGANQAVAASRLGGSVFMVGRVADDRFGRELLGSLARDGVDVRFCTADGPAATGCAGILVEDGGQNSIVVAPGANALLSPADVDAAAGVIASAAAVVLQLEVPVETVRHAAALCRRLGVYTVLDPAPALPGGLPPDLYDVDLLTPNEGEAAAMLNLADRDAAHAEAMAMARALHARGARSVVLKRGGEGAVVVEGEGRVWRAAAFPAHVVDTTAAGDAFTAALAVAHAEGMPLSRAVPFANAAGALCCGKRGAQPSLPTRAEVDAVLARVPDPS